MHKNGNKTRFVRMKWNFCVVTIKIIKIMVKLRKPIKIEWNPAQLLTSPPPSGHHLQPQLTNTITLYTCIFMRLFVLCVGELCAGHCPIPHCVHMKFLLKSFPKCIQFVPLFAVVYLYVWVNMFCFSTHILGRIFVF